VKDWQDSTGVVLGNQEQTRQQAAIGLHWSAKPDIAFARRQKQSLKAAARLSIAHSLFPVKRHLSHPRAHELPIMLTSRITHPLPSPTTQDFVDIFSSSLSALFTDDTQNSHGTPGSHITYASPRFGEMTLHIPAHPDVDEGRKLFAHYLWNAGVVAAEGVEQGSWEGTEDMGYWHHRWWDVRGQRVLELGAGM